MVGGKKFEASVKPLRETFNIRVKIDDIAFEFVPRAWTVMDAVQYRRQSADIGVAATRGTSLRGFETGCQNMSGRYSTNDTLAQIDNMTWKQPPMPYLL